MASSRGKIAVLAFLTLFPLFSSLSQDSKENAEFKLAVNLYNDKMYDLAAEQLKRFIDHYPNSQQSIHARFYLGLTQMEMKQYEAARLTFQNFALSYPENPQAPDAWWNVAEAYVAMNNFLEAASAFERLRVFHPKSKRAPDALLKSASYFRLAGAAERVKKTLRTLIQEYPTSEVIPEARLQLAEVYIEEGNFDQALAELKRVTKRASDPNLKATAFLLTGEIYERQEKAEDAEKAYREIIQSYPSTSSSSEALIHLGQLLQEQGKYLQSIATFKKVQEDTSSETSPLKQHARLSIAKSYFQLKDFSNATAHAEQLLRRNPTPKLAEEARKIAAKSHEEQKDYRGALEYYRAISLDTSKVVDNRAGYIGAARACTELKDFMAAVSYLQSFLTVYPNDPNAPEALYAIGEIYEKSLSGTDAERKAIGSYQALLSRYPRSALVDDALIAVARVQERLKDFDQALKNCNELITRYPASPFVKQAKERIRSITTFEPTPTSASLNKLAQLLASLIASESKGESAFHLGEIYLNDLKDFQAAARMFTSAIENKVAEPNLADAYYYRARAYQLSAEKDQTPADSAVHAYEDFLRLYPSHPRSSDAAAQVALLKISIGAQPDPSKIAEEFVLKYPGSTVGDNVVLAAGDALMKQGKYDRAALSYQQLLAWFPTSAHVEEALYRLGLTMAKLGKDDSARIVYDNYFRKYPDGPHAPEVLIVRAGETLKAGRARDAISEYRTVNEKFFYTSQAERAQFDLATAYTAGGQLDSAITQCQALLQKQRENLFHAGDSLEILHLLGTLYQAKGERTAAKKYYLAYLREDRASERAASLSLTLGRMYREEGNLQTALSFLAQASEIGHDRGVKKEFAGLLFETGDYAAANTQFSELARSASSEDERKDLESRLIIGMIRMGNLPEADTRAKQFTKDYKEVDEQLAEMEFEKGSYYYRKQGYTAALNAFERLIKDYDESKFVPTAHYWIGKIYESTGQNQKALEKYNEILKMFPRADIVPRVYLALGNISYRTEKFDDALRYYRMVVDSSSPPQDILPSAMNNLIEAYKTAGLFDAALQLTRTFISKFPNDESVQDKRIDIGVLYEKLGYHDQSILHLQNLLEDADSDVEAEIRYYIGEAYFGKAEYGPAILEFLKVPYLVTKKGRVDWTPNAFYMSGQAYEKMGKYDQAIGMYQQIVERPGIDQTFKAAAQKEIDRVNTLVKKPTK